MSPGANAQVIVAPPSSGAPWLARPEPEGPVTYVVFPDELAFQTWHDAKCEEHGLPKPGYNAFTGEVALHAQWTVAWAEPIVIGGLICLAVSDEERDGDKVLARLATIVTKDPDEDPKAVPVEAVAFAVAKELPEKWVDANVEYDVAASKEQGRAVTTDEVVAAQIAAQEGVADAGAIESVR